MKAKTASPPAMLSIIVDAYTTDDADCFGKEWKHGHEQCSMCSMQNVCIVLTTKKVQDATDLLLKDFGPWVDEIDFSAVPKEQILQVLDTQAIPIDVLRDAFAQYSKCKDAHTVAIQVNMFIRENKLRLLNGNVLR